MRRRRDVLGSPARAHGIGRIGDWHVFNEHIAEPGDVVFRQACKLGCQGIVSKRLGSRYRSGRSRDWIKLKKPAPPAVRRELEEDWGR